MKHQPEELPVIFRAERNKDADVTAVFPTLPHDGAGRYFTVYAHIGQHGGGGFDWYNKTRWARPEEYAGLLAELKRIYERSHGPRRPGLPAQGLSAHDAPAPGRLQSRS